VSRLTWGDLLDEVARSILAKPSRAGLTTLGTVLGVATVICTVGLAQTAAAQVSARFSALEATRLVVRDSQPDHDPPPFRADRLAALRRTPGVEAVGESWALPHEVPASLLARTDPTHPPGRLTVQAVTPDTIEAVGGVVGSGVPLGELHLARGEPVAVLGAGAAAGLGFDPQWTGRSVYLAGQRLTVIGVLTSAPRRPEFLSAVLVSPGTGLSLNRAVAGADPTAVPHEVTIKVQTGAAQVVAEVAPLVLLPTDPARLRTEVPPSPAEFRDQVQGDLGAVFYVLGGVSLLLGLLGIANSGMVAVMQRRGEFGLRRALGARPRHIAAQVLTEAALLGTLGGVGGLLAGLAVILGTAFHRSWVPVLDPSIMALGGLSGLATGLLAGIYPAWKASRVEPVEALRD
jgi:putative ABC transport system permease protein